MRRWPRPPGPSPWRSGCTKAPAAQGLHLRARSSLRTFTRRPPSNRTTDNRKARAFLRWAAHVRENPDRQPRRDRLPDHQDRAAHGHRDRRGLFRGRRGRAACRNGRRGGRHRPAAGRAILSRHRQDRRGLQARPAPRRCIRATASCPSAPPSPQALADAGIVFIGPNPQRHRGDGRQDRIEEIRQRRQGLDRARAISA